MKRTFATLGVVGLGLLSLTAPAMAASERVTVCHADGSNWAPLEFDVNGIGGHSQHPTDIIPPTPKAPNGKNWNNAGKITYIANCAPLPPGETPPVYPPVVVPPVVVPPVVVDPPVVVPPVVPPIVVPPVVVPPVVVPPVVVPPVVVDPPVVNPPVVVDPPVEQPVVNPPAVVDPPAVVETPVVAPVVQTPVVEQPAVVPPVTVPPAAAAVVVPQQQAAAAGAVATTGLGTNQGYNAQTAVGGSDSPSWLAGAGALMAAGAAVAFRRSRRSLPLAD